jgi:predicted deacylase
VLVAAGFHGEEPGGPLGILRLLETAPDPCFDGIALSLIPILNPTGHRIGQRRNQWNENPNDGFCHPDLDPTPPSKEGRILLANLPLLKQCSKDAFLSLHEDGFPTGHAYAYGARPTGACSALLAEMRPFGITASMRLEDGAMLCDGMSLNHHDGSFEDRLFHEGTALCVCTETPRIAALELRAEVNDRIVRALLLHVGSRKAVRKP